MNAPAPITFRLNAANARAVGAGGQIEQRGAYTGTFTRAEHVTSQKGTQGIEFDFKAEDGQQGKYLTVWISNDKGEELSGRKMIDAILTCVGAREITSARMKTTKWNSETRQEEEKVITGFPDLVGKPVGVVLHREEYATKNGERKWKNALYCPFVASSNCLAAERLDNKPATGLLKILERLQDRPMKAAPAQRAPAHQSDDDGWDSFTGSAGDSIDF